MKQIIIEIIPTSINPQEGEIIQISAILIEGIKIFDRFDYRLNEDKIKIKDFLKIINYDNHLFTYVNSTKEIKEQLKEFIKDYEILFIDNEYTFNYLKEFNNLKTNILDILNLKYHDHVVEEIIKKYKLEPSNHIVDLLYEALVDNENN